MSANDYILFSAKVTHYKNTYEKDSDDSRYTSNCLMAALSLFTADSKELQKRLGKAGIVMPAVFFVGSPLLMAAIDSVADSMHCPVDNKMTAVEFLSHFANQIGRRYDSEFAGPARKALTSVRDGLHSLGFAS